MKKWLGLALIASMSLAGLAQMAESVPDPETESTVPELAAFHEVIAPIWHTAFPAKDYAALRGFVPAIEAGMARINAAALPGILRERQAAWDKELAEFNLAVTAYRNAAAGSDDPALLDAAERLHMRFEMQVRAIRPKAGEVDAYHKVLYVVFHRYLPGRKYAEICAAAPDLAAKAEAITRVTLSRRLESRTAAFQAAAALLLAETRALAAAGETCSETEIPALVARVHDAYMALEKVFE